MPGRLLIILRAEDADAVMKGGSTNRHGNVNITDLRGTAELWAGEADDKGIYLTKIHGGEKKVAERLAKTEDRHYSGHQPRATLGQFPPPALCIPFVFTLIRTLFP